MFSFFNLTVLCYFVYVEQVPPMPLRALMILTPVSILYLCVYMYAITTIHSDQLPYVIELFKFYMIRKKAYLHSDEECMISVLLL